MTVNLRDQLGSQFTDDDLHHMNQAMQDGSGIQLPFRHLQVWAVNGDRRSKPIAAASPVSYFGGWNINAEIVTEMVDAGDFNLDLAATGWARTDMEGRDGKGYTVYEARALHLAPIGRRLSWLTKDGKSRMPDYDPEHCRSHLQLLCLVGCTVAIGDKKAIQCVAPGVISVKGKGQTEAMKIALATWGRAIDGLRVAMNAKGLPLFAWWQTIGTRGEAVFERLGQGTKSSEITPVRALMAETKLTPEQMAARSIGADNFKLAVNLLQDAGEWLAAWRQPGVAAGGVPDAPPDPVDPDTAYGDGHTDPNDDSDLSF